MWWGKNCRLRLQIYRSKLKKIKLRQLPSIKILHKYRWRCLCQGVMFFVIGSESFIVFCLLAYMCLHRHIRYIHSRKRMFLIKKYVRKKNYEEKKFRLQCKKKWNLKILRFLNSTLKLFQFISSLHHNFIIPSYCCSIISHSSLKKACRKEWSNSSQFNNSIRWWMIAGLIASYSSN